MSKDEMIAAINSQPDKYAELIDLATSDKLPHSHAAAWLLSNCTDENDARVKCYIPAVIDILPEVSDGQQRDLINVLHKMELDEDQEGLVFDTCVEIWTRLNKIPSVRYYAMKLIIRIAGKYPELASEVLLLTQDFYLDTLSPGIKNSIKKTIKDFEKSIHT